jgi:hypothetical protein
MLAGAFFFSLLFLPLTKPQGAGGFTSSGSSKRVVELDQDEDPPKKAFYKHSYIGKKSIYTLKLSQKSDF